MKSKRVEEIEKKIEDLKARWPIHSVPPTMLMELEELEDELYDAKKEAEKQENEGEKP